MSFVTPDAIFREDFGKGAARRARRDAKIPAVVYGASSQPLHVLLPAQETTLAVRDRSVELVLNVDGKEVKTTVKELQINALSRNIDHIDLMVAA